MARVYLETSFVSACVTNRTDVASLYRKQVSNEWWETQRSRHELFVSAEVNEELSHPNYPQSAQALELVRVAAALDNGEAVHGFAEILVRERVMSGPAKGDAIHVAAATVHQCKYMSELERPPFGEPKQAHASSDCLYALGIDRSTDHYT